MFSLINNLLSSAWSMPSRQSINIPTSIIEGFNFFSREIFFLFKAKVRILLNLRGSRISLDFFLVGNSKLRKVTSSWSRRKNRSMKHAPLFLFLKKKIITKILSLINFILSSYFNKLHFSSYNLYDQ